MHLPPSRIYGYHVKNLREIEVAIDNVSRLARSSIASNDPHSNLRTLLRMLSFLIGAWAECRLKKLLHESVGFSALERDLIESQRTQLDQWKSVVDLAFRKHHSLPKAELNDRTLGVTQSARRNALISSLDNELRVIIEIRNKLAHGQWIYPFNNEGTAIESDKYCLINKENYLSLHFKQTLLNHLANAVHDLVVSKPTFDRDFDKHFKKLNQVRIDLVRRTYDKFAQKLQNSRQKAREERR